MYDVIIIGARCAGAATALSLARRGHRVLLIDRTATGTDTLSTHYIHRSGTARLARLGLLKAIEASGCPPLGTAHHSIEGVAFHKSITGTPEHPVAYGPRRYILDDLLCNAATAAGAELRRGTITDLLWSENRVTGIRARSRKGTPYIEHAKVVVGADGANSTVARLVRAAKYHVHPRATCIYYTYWVGLPAASGIHIKNRRAVAIVPTHDQAVCVAVTWPAAEFPRIRNDITGNYLRTVRETTPNLFTDIQSSYRTSRFAGTASIDNFYRVAAGPGWALVGDAGFHKDPLPANGISDALEHAELLADHLNQGLTGPLGLDDALIRYARERDTTSLDFYQFTCWLAKMRIPKPVLIKLGELAEQSGNPVNPFMLLAQALNSFGNHLKNPLLKGAPRATEPLVENF